MAVKKKKAAKKKVVKKKVAKKKVAKKKVAKKKVAKKKVAKKKVAKKKAVKKKAVKTKRSSKIARKGQKAIRYTTAKKKQVLKYVTDVNKKKGKGGIAAAVRRFKVSAITINRWKRANIK